MISISRPLKAILCQLGQIDCIIKAMTFKAPFTRTDRTMNGLKL